MKQVNGNGHARLKQDFTFRPYPQETHASSTIDGGSFYGKIRSLYSDKVLKTQLEQIKKQGSYDAFKLEWHPAYDVRRLQELTRETDGIPPSLFWESDVGKWIEGACYFLSSPDSNSCPHAAEFEASVKELVEMIERAQQPDGYLGIYFTVVDPAGKYKNLRDMHEMYNAGHLLEGALAHFQYTKSRQFLDVMIRYVECLAIQFGPAANQLHGYPGHPELELAVLRLYSLTKAPAHLEFARYLLEARGVKRSDQNDMAYFEYEAHKREDFVVAHTMDDINDMSYNQSHLPIHDQETIEGHSVRALYLTTAAADLGGAFYEDAKRLWTDAVDKKMYATGGLGTEPRTEGFSTVPYWLPQSTIEGGCYAETCASIACMMTCERLLSHELDGKVRDIMELCFLNAVLGGGSLDGKQFSYANKHATSGHEVAQRADWFEVCCCPPNLSRTLGMLGGYTWTSSVDASSQTIRLDVYLFVSATKTILLPSGVTASVKMTSGMPWIGTTEWVFDAPEGWKWEVRVPKPEYAEDTKVSVASKESQPGFLTMDISSNATVTATFSLPVRVLAPHPKTGSDTLIVARGPIVYTAESVDNAAIDDAFPHFEGIGFSSTTAFTETTTDINGIPMVMLSTVKPASSLKDFESSKAYRQVDENIRAWRQLDQGLTFVPWFARANRGGAGRVRTAFLRVD